MSASPSENTELDAPTGIARCATDAIAGAPPYTVSGVAIGEGDVTHGANGAKFWPAEALRAAAPSLVGAPLTKNHDDKRVESVIGEVVDAGYQDDVGVIYEAEVDDEEIATQISRGRLDVSIHARHADGGTTDEGAMIVEDARFLDLSVVPRGASASNTVEVGSHEQLAALRDADVATLVDQTLGPEAEDSSSGGPSTDADTMNTDTDTNVDEAEEAEDVPEADADVEEAEAGDDVESEPEAEEAEAEDDVEPDEVETAELRATIEELETENAELREEIEHVRLEYATVLAGDSAFEPEELAEKFALDELKTKLDESDATLADATDASAPAPQTGEPTGELETGSNDADEAEIEQLEAKIETYEELGWEAAKTDAEASLAELTD